MQECKYFELKHFRPKSYLAQTFSNRAYPAACASSELLRACLSLKIRITHAHIMVRNKQKNRTQVKVKHIFIGLDLIKLREKKTVKILQGGFDVLYLTPHVLVPLRQLLLPLLLKLLAVHYLPTLQSSVRNLSCSETFQIRSAREAHACSARRGLAVEQIQSWSFNAVLFISDQSSWMQQLFVYYKENLPYCAKVKSLAIEIKQVWTA